MVDGHEEDLTLDEPLPFKATKRRASKEDWQRFKEQVKSRTRLEDIIHAQWDKKSSTDWWCSSPLRPGQDSKPSFHIDLEKQVWKDFGLEEPGGDVFAFLVRLWGCSFFEALKRRAEELGMQLPSAEPLTPEQQAEMDEREKVETILALAAEHYHSRLPDDLRAYLNDHYGVTDEIIDELQIGFDDGTLYDRLDEEGYDDLEMALTGLFGNAEKDGTRFRGRITFPYWRRGKVVYFAARQTQHTPPFLMNGKDITPKYLKLKTGPTGDELSLVSKTVTNDHFWGEDSADRDVDVLLIPEGMPDAIAAHQAGYPVISPITVQFREKDHDKLHGLCKRARRVVLIPDQERSGAGMKGAIKTCTFLSSQGVDARILVLPHGKEKVTAEAKVEKLEQDGADQAAIDSAHQWKVDLNEWMRGRSRDDLQALIDTTPGHVNWLVQQLPAQLEPEDQDRHLRPILALVARKKVTAHGAYLDLIKARTGLTKGALKAMLAEHIAEAREDEEGRDEEHVHGGFPLTGLGNAERLHHLTGGQVRYVPEWGSFLAFEKGRWRKDRGGHRVRRLAQKMVKQQWGAAKKIDDPDTRKVVTDHWTRSQGRRALDDMVELLKDQPGICIEAHQLDDQPYLANFKNGTLDLKKRELRPHDPADLLTQIIPHNYNPEAECPRYMAYLEAAQPDPEVREWLHRRDGSFLAADTKDQIYVVHYGRGGTGKGTRFRVLKYVMPEYVVKAPRSVFERQRHRPHPADLMTLAGKRLAYGSEISPYLDIDQIKELTGEENFQARGMQQDFSEQKPTFKLEQMTNSKPIIREDPSDGIWRRLRVVPWTVEFKGKSRDNDLYSKLVTEAEGILAWLVEGCYKWMDNDLTRPQAIMMATDELASDQDHITPFIEEVCDTSDPNGLVLAEDLFKARQRWNTARNERLKETQKSFGDAMKAHGYLHGPKCPRTRRARWKGLGLQEAYVVKLEAPGMCALWIDDEAEILDLIESAWAEQARRETEEVIFMVV
ncbi:MAG: phage/plasmid primase, P4 family [Myxococcales bacterium]|nr:phage/plasmid primase, P4 family [Myxococcales bacterium]